MRRTSVAIILTLLLVGAPARADDEPNPDPDITRAELKTWVRRLADDDLEGREAGQPGAATAADWIVGELERLGIEPMGDDGTFFQRFSQRRGLKVERSTALTATDRKGKATTFELGVDFAPHDLSAKGQVSGEPVFAGYGISAPSVGYDDYAGLDVEGRVVVVLRHAPAYRDRKSAFAEPANMQRFATWQAKVDEAAKRGAAALVVVNDPVTFSRASNDTVKPPGGTTTGKIPVIHVIWRAGRKLGARIGISFTKRQKQIDGKGLPRSKVLEGATLSIQCDLVPDFRQMKNVLGLLTPEGPSVTGDGDAKATQETLVIGAHYDHVGRGWFGSLAKAGGTIHNGADDNASGTAALLEIVEHIASRRAELERRVLFVWFSGEELGLLGSKHYVGAPTVPLSDTVAMLNLDMVGRLDKNHLMVGGTGTSPIWSPMLQDFNKEARFKLTSWPGGRAPSDHTSFYDKDIPVLFFFTGLHSDYHRPTDDWQTLEYKGHERVARFVARIAMDLATRPARPAFTRCDAGGFNVGPYIGVSVEPKDDGVYVAFVEKKSPASRAGFKAGDKILEWNKTPIPNANQWNSVLSKAKPGEKVQVVVERNGRRRRLNVKLGKT